MGRIENHKFTIDECFRECFYVVPDYQREYVWAEEQVIQLLEDFHEHMSTESSEYFIGTILVTQRSGQKSHYDLIDGQQRLTTTFLMLCVLRVLFKGMEQGEMIDSLIQTKYTDIEGNIQRNLKLEPRYENACAVLEKIIEVNDLPQAVIASLEKSSISLYGSIQNIVRAYGVIYKFMNRNYSSQSELKKYWGYLNNNVVFIQISTDVSNALKIFETINDRGVGLDAMDLLKNLLFSKLPKDDFSRLKTEWDKIRRTLGGGDQQKVKELPLRFLRYFIIAKYSAKSHFGSKITEGEIYNWFAKKENAKLTGYEADPFVFVRDVQFHVEHHMQFLRGYGNDGSFSVALESIQKLAGQRFRLHLILLLAVSDFPSSLFEQFVMQLENVLFIALFTKEHSKNLSRHFDQWVVEIQNIARNKGLDVQKKELNSFVQRRFGEYFSQKENELKDAIKRLSQDTKECPQYRMRYLLERLTQYVDMAFHGQKERSSLELYSKLDLEHILPQKPTPRLRSEWDKNNPEAVYTKVKQRLGNLVLLEKPINSSIGNASYAAKKRVYAKSSYYLTRSLDQLADIGKNTSISRINTKLESFDNWNAEDIEKRQLMLLDLVMEVWQISEID